MNTRHILQRGFTLAEMVIVIVITGIIGGMVAVFLRAPVQGYFDMETRVELTDAADTALRRIGRDIRLALPNSILTNPNSITFLQTRTGGRYRARPPGNILDTADNPAQGLPSTSSNPPAFNVLGVMSQAPVTGDFVVVYNLGILGADAYTSSNSAQISAFDAGTNTITLTAPFQFPFESPSHRFHVVETPVTYVCNAGTLTRFWGYAIANAQNPPAGAPSALIAQNVSACAFTYNQLVNERNGLVTMQISLTKNNETVTLYHEVHVSNVP